jgi:hypothetical protein
MKNVVRGSSMPLSVTSRFKVRCDVLGELLEEYCC